MRILALIGSRPLPPIAGPAIRFAYLWPHVAHGQDVELKVLGLDIPSIPTTEPARFPGLDAEFLSFGPRGFANRVIGRFSRSWHEYPYCPELAQRVDELIESFRPDVIHADEFRMAAYLPSVRGRPSTGIQSVTFHNVETDLFAKLVSPAVPWPLKGLASRLQVRSLKQFENRVAHAVSLRFAYSDLDRQRYSSLYPDLAWKTTRNGVNASDIQPAPQVAKPSVFLLGRWSYGPNMMGLRWLLDEVRPHLDPALEFVVAGSGASETIKTWVSQAGWTFHDTPLDLSPFYAEAAVVAVPVLEGSGTRGKILEALAHERMVVTTTKGPEGLNLGADSGIVIADEPRQFAQKLAEVATSSPESRAEAAHQGRQAVLAHYDWSVVASELLEAWNSCISP
ncbi:MAG TPA: glycosyltransferase [Isosphaeraceae bacterium]|nr:glycosyltransferase [Isosphaeraceae bacterium]